MKNKKKMRLIYADTLHDKLKAKQKWVVKRGEKHNEGYTYDQVHFAIDDTPTVDAIPIEWMKQKYPAAVNHDSVRYISKVNLLNEIIEEWRKEE